MEKEYINELVIKAGNIETRGGWTLSSNDNLCTCQDCKSPLFYVKIDWGVVEDDNEYMVLGNRSKRTYSLREIGLSLYCSKCSSFFENYSKYFYPKDKVVFYDFTFDELESDERAEIQNCLHQWNQKGDFNSRYKDNIFKELKEKLIEYEKKYPIKQEKIKRLHKPRDWKK